MFMDECEAIFFSLRNGCDAVRQKLPFCGCGCECQCQQRGSDDGGSGRFSAVLRLAVNQIKVPTCAMETASPAKCLWLAFGGPLQGVKVGVLSLKWNAVLAAGDNIQTSHR